MQLFQYSAIQLLYQLIKLSSPSAIIVIYYDTKKGGRFAVHAVAAKLNGKHWLIHDPNEKDAIRVRQANIESIKQIFEGALFARVLGPEASQPTVDCPATLEGLQKRIKKGTNKHID